MGYRAPLTLASCALAFAPALLAQDLNIDSPRTEAGGMADVAVQGYYLGGNSQPMTSLSGLNLSFREYLPSFGLFTGNIEGYADSARGRTGDNSVTLHGVPWKGRRWTITGGDFRYRTSLTPVPFTNYSYPEIGVRGARVEMSDGARQFTFFWGEETLQTGPRITFRTPVPQTALGAVVQQSFGSRLRVGVRYLGLASSEKSIERSPLYFPGGSEFRRSDSLSAQATFFAGRGLTLFADGGATHVAFADTAIFPSSSPLSLLTGARWETKRLTITANYGRLTRSALPTVGYYFGDRAGPFAEIRYKVFGTFELFGSALTSHNNLERDPLLPGFSTHALTGGMNVALPGQIGVSGQFTKVGLRGGLASEPSQYDSQSNSQAQVSLTKTLSNHSLMTTVRELDLNGVYIRQKQKSAELQDNMHFSRFTFGGAARFQQESGSGRLQNSVSVRVSAQARFRTFSAYGQFETGNDLINKTLFATNTVRTLVAGTSISIAHDWSLQAEMFRTNLLSTLNAANILVLQTQGENVSDILNNFNQWSLLVKLNHHTHWGAPLPEAMTDSLINRVVYGAVEGYVYDSATGSHGVAGISISLDRSRTRATDGNGHYRFDDVPEGGHAIALNMDELPADFSPGPAPPASIPVKPRAIARVDLRVVTSGSSIRGAVQGLALEDRGIARLEDVVINLAPGSSYTTCDGGGEFAFYNLTPGQYRLSIDLSTLPEGYVPDSEVEAAADLGGQNEAPVVVFRIRKHVEELPVRKVFEATAR